MSDVDLTRLHFDVYDTRRGPCNPELGELEIPEHFTPLPREGVNE